MSDSEIQEQEAQPLLDTGAAIETKPKKPRSEKQKAAFEKMISAKNKKNAERLQAKKAKKESPVETPAPAKPNITTNIVEPDSGTDEEVVYKKAPKKKKKKKRRVIYEQESSSSSEEEVAVVKRRKKPKPKPKVIYEDELDASSDPEPEKEQVPQVQVPVQRRLYIV